MTIDAATTHQISWDHGRLVLHDHHLPSERILGRLGGVSCPCVLVLDALTSRADWNFDAPSLAREQHALQKLTTDADYLSLPDEERLDLLLSARCRLAMHLAPPMAAVISRARELHLARLPRPAPPLQPRKEINRLLCDAAVPLLEHTMRTALPSMWGYAPLVAECWKQERHQSRLIHGRMTQNGGYLVISLPVSWLNDVWRRGIAVTDGQFVVSADKSAPSAQMTVDVLRWVNGHDDCLHVVTATRVIYRTGNQWKLG